MPPLATSHLPVQWEFLFYERLPEPVLSATVGADDYLRGLTAGSAVIGSGVLTGAVDITRYDGPWKKTRKPGAGQVPGALCVSFRLG